MCVPTKKVLHKLINYGVCSMREGDTYTTIYDIETSLFVLGLAPQVLSEYPGNKFYQNETCSDSGIFPFEMILEC